MPTREIFFYKPETVREMVGNRILLPATERTLVDIIDDELRPGHAIVVDFDIIPDRDPIDGTPYYKEEDSHHKSARFLKRGPQVEVMKFSTLNEAMNAAVLPYLDRHRNIKEADLTIPISGYGWWGKRVKQHKKVHLVDCINGAKIFAFSRLNQHDEERIITTREYNSDNTRGSLQWLGGDYLFEVPSTSDEIKHDVLFYSVPIARGRSKHARILDLGAEQSAKAVTKRVTKRYAGRELYFGKHAIAAYIEMARLEREDNGNTVPLQMCPFALPSQMTVDFYNKLEKRVMMMETYTTEDGKERTKKRPLNKAEKEILLWQFVAKHGPAKTLFAREKMQDYRWHRMYEPANRAA